MGSASGGDRRQLGWRDGERIGAGALGCRLGWGLARRWARLWRCGVACVGLGWGLGIGCVAQEARLNLFIWSEYIEPGVLRDFERRYGCRVVVEYYEDDAAMMAKLRGGGAGLYDVVVPPDHRVPAMIQLKLLAPLRHGRLPNLANLDARFRDPAYDRGNRYTVAYQWGTVGLFVRRVEGQALPDSWGAAFDPARQVTPFVLMDSPRDLIGCALRYLGHPLNSVDARHLRDARDLLWAAKPRALGFEGSVGGKNKVLGGLARAAIVYSGEAVRGMADDPQTAYVIPREGSIIWQDTLAILAQAPQRDLAEQFLNFVLEPEIGARISNFTQFASPNRAARPYLRPGDLANPAIYPPAEVLKRLEPLADLVGHARLYDEVWTHVKSK
ncbi:MAG: spermidine/putrescine ABC transporter substrate-binding protein [Verrucomicrobia bacterium]|nr:spermidine/putrescine ABC transporter substrate-binding protein [Verrucomicrobiota bacterium]